ncbi:MAG: hypothetical protein ACLU70_01610 [Lachnospira sp.]
MRMISEIKIDERLACQAVMFDATWSFSFYEKEIHIENVTEVR